MAYAGFNIVQNFLPINEFTRPGTKITPQGMVVHWTGNINAGADDVGNARFFINRKGTYGSAHYILDSDSIQWMLPENEMAYHVGASRYYTTKFGTYPNKTLIGLEVCVPMNQDFNKTYAHAVKFAAAVCKKYGWNPADKLVRHYDVTRKDCPLNMIDLVNDVKHVRWSVESQFASKKSKLSATAWEALVQSGIKHIQQGLSINGVRGNALWNKFIADVKSAMNGSFTQPTPSAPTTTYITVDRGDTGAAVKELQTLLNQAGFNAGVADGIFGAGTEVALKKFQASKGLVADGVAGPSTWAALKKPKPQPAPVQTPQKVEENVQKVVAILGKYFADLPDNRWSAPALNELKEAKIFNGSVEGGKTLAKPTAPITREEVGQLIYNAIKFVQSGGKL